MNDLEVKCQGPYEGTTCPNEATFLFTVSEQEFFKEKGFQSPKRCPLCRDLKKSRFNDTPKKNNEPRVRDRDLV